MMKDLDGSKANRAAAYFRRRRIGLGIGQSPADSLCDLTTVTDKPRVFPALARVLLETLVLQPSRWDATIWASKGPTIVQDRTMGKRLSVDDKLAALRLLRDQPPSQETTAELRRALGDKASLVVASASEIAGEQRLIELSPAVEAAFERFLVDPEKTDKLCRAKIAIVQSLDRLDHDQPDVFLQAARHVQMEPVWGGEEDTAAPLRAAAIFALARIGYHGMLLLLVDALTDPEKEVRLAATQVLGEHGTETACLLLRLKARIGDRDPEIVSECLFGLLNGSPNEYMPFVSEFINSKNAGSREAAILALGKSRLPEAFDALKTCWQQDVLGTVRAETLLAMAMLRLPVATDFLLELVATEPEATALQTLGSLLIHRHDSRLRERLAAAVQQNNSRALRAKFERDFHVTE
jgi:HEAT repeat protein